MKDDLVDLDYTETKILKTGGKNSPMGLNKLYFLKLEIESIKEEIRNIPTVSSPQISGMPHGSGGVNDRVFSCVMKKEELIERLNRKIERYTEELVRIENIIDRIDDIEIRAIARLRYVQCLKWEDIGERMHMERTTCAKKLNKYIKSMNI